MKKLIAISAAAAIIAMSGTAMAAATANLAVSASVTNSCSVTGGTLAFGALTTGTVNATSAGVTVTCTKGDPYSLSVNTGANNVGTQANMKNTGNTDLIPYSLTVPAPSAGTGAPQTIAMTGTITTGTYSMASAGTYNDTILITVTP